MFTVCVNGCLYGLYLPRNLPPMDRRNRAYNYGSVEVVAIFMFGTGIGPGPQSMPFRVLVVQIVLGSPPRPARRRQTKMRLQLHPAGGACVVRGASSARIERDPLGNRHQDRCERASTNK